MSKRTYCVEGHDGEKDFTRTTSTMKYRWAALLSIDGECRRAVGFSATSCGAVQIGRSWLKELNGDYGISIAPVKLIKGSE